MTGSTALPNEVHVSISLPYYMVQPMCRIFPGGNAYICTNHMNDMANGAFVNFIEIASLKFEFKNNLGMFPF